MSMGDQTQHNDSNIDALSRIDVNEQKQILDNIKAKAVASTNDDDGNGEVVDAKVVLPKKKNDNDDAEYKDDETKRRRKTPMPGMFSAYATRANCAACRSRRQR